MIYFFDKELKFVDGKNEIAFSYNKKINREGSGKLELSEMPKPESFFISIYHDEKYIASGFITEIQINTKNVSITFSTFETLLKNYRLPKVFNNFDGMSEANIISNLFYSFNPIIKSKKKDFSSSSNGYDMKALYVHGVLGAENIEFGKIKDGDFHLSFDENYKKKNEFRYNTKGNITFWFDLGEPTINKKEYFYNESSILVDSYGDRFLRFTASLGNKADIKVKAIESDVKFLSEASSSWDMSSTPYIPIDKSIKDFEKTIGVPLPSTKRYLAIRFEFIYDKPNWVQDYSALDVYDKNGKLVKRTVRGFTPCLHGLEILNRKAIPPFNDVVIKFDEVFPINAKDEKGNILSNEKLLKLIPYENSFKCDVEKIKFSGLTMYEALIRFLDIKKYNIAIALKISGDDVLYSKGVLAITLFNDDEKLKRKTYGFDRTCDEKAIFRLHDGQASLLNNYILKTIRKRTNFLKMLHYYGEGDGQDVLYVCLFNSLNQNSDGSFSEKLNVYTPCEIVGSLGTWLQDQGISQVTNASSIPDMLFIEERIEDSNIKDFQSLLIKAKEHFIEEQKKIDYSFEIESNLNVSLHDKVLLLHEKSLLQLKARIVEEKISVKKNIINKTFGIGGFLFNPFDSLFRKKEIIEVVSVPQTPFNLRAFTQDEKLFLTWDCIGEATGYLIEVRRLDGRAFSDNIKSSVAFFHSQSKEISLNSFNVKTLYALSIYSYIENIKSLPSSSIYFKITDGNEPIRILGSLLEKGNEEGEKGFFLDLAYRESVKNELIAFFKFENEQTLNSYNEAEHPTNNYPENMVEKEIKYYGLVYVWQKGQWIDARIRYPEHIIFYFDFDKKNVTPKYKKEVWEILYNFLTKLKRFENLRQRLTYLTKKYTLPKPSDTSTFSLEEDNSILSATGKSKKKKKKGKGWQHEGDEPLLQPIGNYQPQDWGRPTPSPPSWGHEPPDWGRPTPFPPFGRYRPPDFDRHPPSWNYPPPIQHADHREAPPYSIKQEWDRSVEEYNRLRTELERLKSSVPFYSFSNNREHIFDLSDNENHLEFNIPIFNLLTRQYVEEVIYGGADNVYLDKAISFLWQSTLTDGLINWEKEKPFFRIKKLTNKNKKKYLLQQRGESHTLAFYLRIKDADGFFELWNVDNYNIGYVQDGYLHFGFLIHYNNKPQYLYFYKKSIAELMSNDANSVINIKESSYVHIMVKASYYYNHFALPYGDTYYSFSQKIYINFEEVPIKDYKDGKNSAELSSDKYTLKPAPFAFSLFNFNEVSRDDEKYDIKTSGSPYTPLPRFDLRFSHLFLFDDYLEYGERQYIKNNVLFQIKKDKIKNNADVVLGKEKSVKESKYKGICVSDVNAHSNKVKLYKIGEISFNKGEFFLMGCNRDGFKAGFIYEWNDNNIWNELTPHSLYHKEYVLAYNDIIEMRRALPDVFFKDFMMNAFQISENIYSKTMQTNTMIIQDDFYLNNIKTGDPHVKGQVYISSNDLLKISKG
ncbi:MAG: hypothetical protein ACTTIZ_01845 [Treponema sp.]